MSAHAPAVIESASRATWRHAAADLDAEPRSVPAARHLVRLVLRSWGLENTAGTAELITAELVTNAIAASAAAGHAVIRLRLTRRAWSLLVQVWDASPGLPEAQLGPADALGGRGLVLVEALADRWGLRPGRRRRQDCVRGDQPVSWSSEDAIDRARDELARQAETLHLGWRFGHGVFGWTATREGQTLTGSTMPGLLAQIASADGIRHSQHPAGENPGK